MTSKIVKSKKLPVIKHEYTISLTLMVEVTVSASSIMEAEMEAQNTILKVTATEVNTDLYIWDVELAIK